MTTVAHTLGAPTTGQRRPRRTPSSDPLGLAAVPPRVAPADPGDRSAHRCGHGRGHAASRSPTTRAPSTTRSSAPRTPCSSWTAPIRASWRQVSPPPRNGSGRPTSSATARCPSRAVSRPWSSGPRTRADRTHGSPSAEAATRKAPARSPSPTESRRSSGSRSGRLSPSTAVAEPSSASSRTHVSSATSSPSSHPRPPEHRTPSRSWSTPTTRRSARSGERTGRPVRPTWGPSFGATTSRHPSWRCSPWPPSSCCWLRSLPRQASPSSRSDGSASSACSLRSARPKSTFDSCCSRTAQSSARSAH